MPWRAHRWSCLISIPGPLAPWDNLRCSEMRGSHWSQDFKIIAFTLEVREMNETQVTMSGVLTRSVTVYPSCQLNSIHSYDIQICY